MSEEDDDPFADMAPADDREGDPFERLGEPDESSVDSEATDTADETADVAEGFTEADQFIDGHDDTPELESETGADAADADPFDDRDGSADPFSEMDATGNDPFDVSDAPDHDPFAGMDRGDGDPFGSAESVFESVDIDALDEDELWNAIEADDDTSPVTQKRYSEVSKHRFCEQCEFFAEPPASHCTHEDARILEHLDMETVRVVDCPIVAEQERIENEE